MISRNPNSIAFSMSRQLCRHLLEESTAYSHAGFWRRTTRDHIPDDHRVSAIPVLGGLHHEYKLEKIAARRILYVIFADDSPLAARAAVSSTSLRAPDGFRTDDQST